MFGVCRTEVKSLLVEIQETITTSKGVLSQIQSDAVGDTFIDHYVIPLLQSALPECKINEFLSVQVHNILCTLFNQ